VIRGIRGADRGRAAVIRGIREYLRQQRDPWHPRKSAAAT
jgi:hypothetical protein